MTNYQDQINKMTIKRMATMMSIKCDICPLHKSGSACLSKENRDKTCYKLVSEWLQQEKEDFIK